MLGLSRLKGWACRRLGAVPLADYLAMVRERDDCSALAARRYDDLMALYRISVRKAEAVQADLDAIRAEAVDLETRHDKDLQAKAAHIRKLIHDVRGHL